MLTLYSLKLYNLVGQLDKSKIRGLFTMSVHFKHSALGRRGAEREINVGAWLHKVHEEFQTDKSKISNRNLN